MSKMHRIIGSNILFMEIFAFAIVLMMMNRVAPHACHKWGRTTDRCSNYNFEMHDTNYRWSDDRYEVINCFLWFILFLSFQYVTSVRQPNQQITTACQSQFMQCAKCHIQRLIYRIGNAQTTSGKRVKHLFRECDFDNQAFWNGQQMFTIDRLF